MCYGYCNYSASCGIGNWQLVQNILQLPSSKGLFSRVLAKYFAKLLSVVEKSDKLVSTSSYVCFETVFLSFRPSGHVHLCMFQKEINLIWLKCFGLALVSTEAIHKRLFCPVRKARKRPKITKISLLSRYIKDLKGHYTRTTA